MPEEKKQTEIAQETVEKQNTPKETPQKPQPRRRSSDFVSPGLVDYEPPVLRCLSLVAGLLGRPVSTVALKAGMPQGRERPPLAVCIRAAEQAGLIVRTFHKPRIQDISSLIMPCILVLQNDQACILSSLKMTMPR